MANPRGIATALELLRDDFTAEEVVKWAHDAFGDGLVLQTSGGIQAAVMLKLVTSVVPNVKVVFVDTGYLPQDTMEYMETLRRELNLNLTISRPKLTPQEIESQYGKLWETDNHLYGDITKVEPMNRALDELGATAILSGLRSEQTSNRGGLSTVSFDMGSHRFKILPILKWSKPQVKEFQANMNLSRHPLESKGFATVGDAHSSRALKAGETNERATRFGGKAQECGLHSSTVPVEQLIVYLKEPLPAQNGYVIFSKPNCKYCKAAKHLLQEQGLHFTERDVTDTGLRIEMYNRVPTAKVVPQIFMDDAHIGGFEELYSKLSPKRLFRNGKMVAVDSSYYVEEVQKKMEKATDEKANKAMVATLSAASFDKLMRLDSSVSLSVLGDSETLKDTMTKKDSIVAEIPQQQIHMPADKTKEKRLDSPRGAASGYAGKGSNVPVFLGHFLTSVLGEGFSFAKGRNIVLGVSMLAFAGQVLATNKPVTGHHAAAMTCLSPSRLECHSPSRLMLRQ